MSKVRLTITLDEEVLEAYKVIAEATGTKLSPCINDWLASTAPAFQLMAKEITTIRERPAQALNELILFQEKMRSGMAQVNDVIGQTAKAEKEEDQATPAAETREEGARTMTPRRPVTPHSNTGVNPPASNYRRAG